MEIIDTRKDKKSKADFLEEVRDSFDWAWTYDQINRVAAENDLDNLSGNQWDAETARQRKIDHRPMLTINKLPGFVDQVKGDARLNTMSVKVKANHPSKKGKADTKALADIYNGLIRQIEQVSDADSARLNALDGSIGNGFGFYEVVAIHDDEDTFDQDIRIKRIKNQFSCIVDPMHVDVDARDARYWFKTDMIRRKDFEHMYPGKSPSNFEKGKAGTPFEHWIKKDQIRVAEYWVKRPYKRTLVSLDTGETYYKDEWEKIEDDLKEKEQVAHVNEQGEVLPGQSQNEENEITINPVPEVVREREINSHIVVKYIVDGSQILDGPRGGDDENGEFILNFTKEDDYRLPDGQYRKHIWPGKFIPIIPVWGKELQIANQTIRRSLIRFAIDPQKMFNYERTAETERIALAKIPPALLTPEQVKGFEAMWGSTKNLKYLLYNSTPGQSPPFFPPPPQPSSGNTQLSAYATQDMKDTMSIQEASLGQQGNEKSGKAILARQRENDVANYEFIDNLRRAVKLEGDIIVDLIPHIYDTERVILVLNGDGSDEFVEINKTVTDEDTGEDVILNDLTQGKYLVTVTAGPNFTTQRVETAEALTSLAGNIQDPVAGLILITKIIKNMDWPGSDETAETLEKLLPPGLIETEEGQEPSPMQQPQEQEDPMDKAKLEGQMLKNSKTQLDIEKQSAEMGKGRQALTETVEQIKGMLHNGQT